MFLLSMRSGAVGINLTAANHVFLMEPAFNPALEDQAVGRAHRMGQTRPVTVKKFYIQARACTASLLQGSGIRHITRSSCLSSTLRVQCSQAQGARMMTPERLLHVPGTCT